MEQSQLADYLSQLIEYDDWMLNPLIFRYLDLIWGPLTIDGFDDWCTAQLPQFNSCHWRPCTEAVHAFKCDQGGEKIWWLPPICPIPRVLKHAKVTKASSTLELPKWLSVPFWPMLYPDGVHQLEFIWDLCEFPSQESLFLAGPLGCLRGCLTHPCWHCSLLFHTLDSGGVVLWRQGIPVLIGK